MGEVEADDAGVRQRNEFAALRDAVLRNIAPELQFCEGGVGGVDHAVAIRIQCGEGCKSIRGEGAVGQYGEVAEQLRAGVDGAVTVSVPHQQGVVRTRPAGLGEDAVVVVVEVDIRGEADCLQAVAVEVENDGVAGRLPAFGVVERVFCSFVAGVSK